jgi:molybdenum cofactor cytidylyltransferase
MIRAERVAAVLLAAGRSTRFGEADKLSTLLDGVPLGLHAARTLAGLPFGRLIAVTGAGSPDYAAHGFAVVHNPAPEEGLSGSLRLGIAAAGAAGDADAVLVALADMPLVEHAHLERLLERFAGDGSIVASLGTTRSPPALFGRDWFKRLAALDGDRGAGAYLREADLVSCDPRMLTDIDTLADLARLSDPGA